MSILDNKTAHQPKPQHNFLTRPGVSLPPESNHAVAGAGRTVASLRSFCFCLHCHSSKIQMKSFRSKSGHRVSMKKICVSWWHCQSMKSLSRSTPLVRTKISRGGSFAVYICLSRVSAVIVSGFGKPDLLAALFRARSRGGGESGCSVCDEESPSLSFLASSPSEGSVSSASVSGIVGRPPWPSSWRERIFRWIRDGEKGVALGGEGARNS